MIMKTTQLILACLALSLSPGSGADMKKPNIIFVLFDDMGYGQPQSYNP